MSSGGGTTSAPLDFAVNDTNSYDPATATGTNSMSAGAGASATGANSIASGNNAKATAANAVALGNASVADRANTVSVGAAGAERQVTNVAAGTASTDAVNMAQLTQAASETAHYDTNADGTINYNSFSVGKANLAPAVIHNVADGTLDTDAANVGQLNQVADWSKAYTDSRVSAINQDIQRANSRASAGVASAMAMAGLPQAYEPGRNMAAVAGGSYRGESSMAIGVSMISDNGRWVYKLNGTTNTRGDGGVSIGAGMQW
jgi:autotransporter adhesin